MMTAKDLMRIYEARDDWKHLKLWVWANDYEAKVIEWMNLFPPVKDDRREYLNTYKTVYDAIDSLPDNPPEWVCVAISHELRTERERMNGILSRFN